jgi:dihydrofolate synthase/folylpolyglutamate synthase
MTYEEAMQFWLGRVNYEQRSPQPGDLKLDRMRGLLHLLGDPHERLRIVHIGGSKGKGSTSAMLAAILRCAGYRTGLFTSPHLVEVEERFQVDDQPISREELVRLLAEIRDVCQSPQGQKSWREDLNQGLTFFEIATAVAFLFFVRRRVEVAVLEVGLGGRFDSTNVCRSLLSIITSISFDHTQLLGNTLDRIAGEKAGIIKPRQPVLSGARSGEARKVIEQACRERQARLRQLDMDLFYRHEPACIGRDGDQGPRVEVTTKHRRWPKMELGLLGEHQAANAALAVAAVEELRQQGLHLSDQAVRQGLAEVRWPARLEVVGRQPLIVLDCAHNVASAQALVQALLSSFPLAPKGKRLLIFAGNGDKDLQGMLQTLAPHFAHLFLTRFQNNPRCVPPEQVAELLPSANVPPYVLCPGALEALEKARQAAGSEDLICVAGSVFLAGELRPFLVK